MKNLKRLMSVVLSVVMLLSFVVSTSAATFTDVAESDKAFEAVEILAALKILEGKEAGVFDPNANIKRSEFAAVICRAMNQSPVGVASFTDVATDHWAYNYIAWAASQKIVNGRGDGTFDPDANVTYNEAIAMIVRAMGYEFYVEEYLGGFPTGYARVAGSYKIDADVNTSNGNAAATRADVASLIYNAFDAPLMDYNYAIGADMEYVIYNGSKNVEGEKRTLLSYYSDIYKFKATVGTTFKNATNNNYVDNKGNKKMDLTVESTYGFEAEWLESALGKDIEKGDTLSKVIANNEAWADYSGYTVDAYITLNDAEDLEVVAMVIVASGEELVIENARERILAADVADDTDEDVTFEYEDENGEEELDVVKTATLYYNNIKVGAINGAAEAMFERLDNADDALNGGANPGFPAVTLVDGDDDGSFDMIYVTEYEYGIVEEIDADYEIIETTYNTYELSEDDTKPGFVYNIYKDGAQIGIEDLAEGDMLNVVIGEVTGNVAAANFVDIYVTNNTIESSVSSVGSMGYRIDGEDYTLAPTAICGSLKPGDTGIFYLTIDGYIYDVDKTSAHSDNYGFILDMGKTEATFGGETWQIKILDKNNEVKVLPVKNSMFVTDTDTVSSVYDRRQYKATDGTLSTKMTSIAALLESTTDAAAVEANFNNRLVTFKEVNGEITELVFALDDETEYDEFNIVSTSNASYSFNKRAGRLGNYELLDNSVLFVAPASAIDSKDVDVNNTPSDTTDDVETWFLDADKVQVYAQSGLKDDAPYNGFLFDIDANRGFGAAVITDGIQFAGEANALAVITSTSEGLDAAGNTVTVLSLIQGSEAKSLTVTDGYALDADIDAAGDVIQFTVNAAGEINDAVLVYDYDTKVLQGVGTPGEIEYAVGVVKEARGKNVDTVRNGGSDLLILALDETSTNVLVNVARIDKANGFDAKSSASYLRTPKFDASNGNVFNSDAYVVVARIDDGDTVDIVAYQYDETTVAAKTLDTFAAEFTVAS